MAIIATGSKTIIDLSDGKSLSVYLGANQPRTQINDVNANIYSPDWITTAGKLTVTPVVYANQTAIALSDTALTIVTIYTNRVSASTTHTLLYTFGNTSGTIATNVGASVNWTPALTLAAQIPNAIRRREFERFITELEKLPEAVSEFDEALWGSLVEYVTVGKDKTMVFTLIGGTEMKA